MKKGAFSGLLYREWVLIKKPLIITFVTSLSTIILAFLVVLSFRCGNLALLDENLKTAVLDDFAFVIKALPLLAVCLIVSAPSESAATDSNIKWERFRRTTPASCLRFALAKYTVFAVLTLTAAGAAFGVMALMCKAMGTTFTSGDADTVLVLLAVVVIFSVIMQVAVTHFKSTDKAGLAVTGIMMACFVLVIAANRDIFYGDPSMTNIEMFDMLAKRFAFMLPAVPFIIAAALALGLLATTMIYKRREK